ncbi:MAG TPA: carbohydrate kinase family protein, partial [Planctomycetota bacterium]|nr:carbohydrate kinase family protein [Planctomycetota bacterium]
SAESTPFSFIMIPESGNRRILHTLGAAATFSPADIDPASFKGVKWVSLNGLALLPGLEGENLAKVLQQAKAAGARTAADTAINDRWSPKEWEALFAQSYGLLDVLFPSEVEARMLTGETVPRKIVEKLKKRGVKIAGVKLGDKGSALLTDEGYFEVPIYPVKCIDTLGAGDCFMAGFLAGMVRGMQPQEAALLGNATSAHCVQAVGATTGIPKLSAVLEFQKKHNVRVTGGG